MRLILPIVLAIAIATGCQREADPKYTDTDPTEHKMRATAPGEQRIDVIGDDEGNILVRREPYGESATWDEPVAAAFAAQTIYVDLEEGRAHGELFWAERDGGPRWEASNFAPPAGWETGIEDPSAQPEATGQGWVVVCPLGVTVSFEAL